MREITLGINASCAAEEKFFERLESARTQRINHGAKADFLWEIYGKLVGSLERYQVEVIWKGPRRVGREVILRAACVRMTPPPNISGHRDA